MIYWICDHYGFPGDTGLPHGGVFVLGGFVVAALAAVGFSFWSLNGQCHSSVRSRGPWLWRMIRAVFELPTRATTLLQDLVARLKGATERAVSEAHGIQAALRPEVSQPLRQPLDEHRIQTVTIVLAIVLYVLTIVGFIDSAFVAICSTLAIFNSVWGFFAYWFPRTRGWFVAALGVVVAFGWRDEPVETAGTPCKAVLENKNSEPCSPDTLLSNTAVLDEWLKRQDPARKPSLTIVATSGGAIRAASWTVIVLHAIEKVVPGFDQSIRIITGASGGMVGAAHYVTSRAKEPPWPFEAVLKAVSSDSLTVVAKGLVDPFHQRGELLEGAWTRANDELRRSFQHLKQGEKSGSIPSLVFAPMLVEDGRRLLITNLDLGMFFRIKPDSNAASISAMELFRVFPAMAGELSVATAARMSATFPWLTSALVLPAPWNRRVVDAGYYDNYGVDVAAAWIRSSQDWLCAHLEQVLIVQIRDQQRGIRRSAVCDPQQLERNACTTSQSALERLVSPFTTPIEAVVSARESSMGFRNDQELTLLQEVTCRANLASDGAAPRPLVKVVTFELQSEAPLNWHLSDKDKQQVRHAMPCVPGSGAGDAVAIGTAEQTAYGSNQRALLELFHAMLGNTAAAPSCLTKAAHGGHTPP